MVEKTVTVRDCMSRKVLSFDLSDDVANVVSLLLEHRITGAPVLDADRNVIGFVSEQDCIKEMLNTAFYGDLTATVGDVMKRDVLTVEPEMPVAQLAEQLIIAKPRVYPVVEAGSLIGIISRSDVLKALFDASVRSHHLTSTKATV